MSRERTEEECLTRVGAAVRARRVRGRTWRVAELSAATLGFATVLAGRSAGWAAALTYSPMLVGVLSPFTVLLLGLWRSRSLADAVRGLHDPGAVRLVTGLLRDDCGRQVHAAALDKLGEMLPRVPQGSPALSEDELYLLLMHLCGPHRDRHGCYCVASLDAFASGSYLRALGATKELARTAPDGPVREAAIRCRDRLLAVQADAERSGSLLRPAEAPGEALLRPAEPVPEEQLLRAVEGEAE